MMIDLTDLFSFLCGPLEKERGVCSESEEKKDTRDHQRQEKKTRWSITRLSAADGTRGYKSYQLQRFPQVRRERVVIQ